MYPTSGSASSTCVDDATGTRPQAVGELCPQSLTEVGFVHLSAPQQVHLPANRLFAGRTDLVLLHVDPRALGSPVRWEPGVATDPESMLFPHLYGPLPVEAVIDVTSYLPGPDGRFPRVRAHPDVGVDLDLDQQVGLDQGGDLDHRRRGPDLAEDLGVHRADRPPLGDVGDEDAGADHVGQGRAQIV